MARKNQPNRISVSQADATLQNVFSACNTRPNTIPISKFVLQQKVYKAYFKTSLFLCFFLIIATMLAPLPFIMTNNQSHPNAAAQESISIISDYVEDDVIYLEISSPLSLEQCYMIMPDQTQQPPISYDESSRTIAFPYAELNVSIYVVDENGHSATIIISPK